MSSRRKDEAMPRIHVSLALVAGLLLAAPLGAVAAPPELRVTATCETAAAAIPGTTTATIALTAGTDDATGQPTQVSALDFALTFGASTFTVTGVRLAAALTANGAWLAPDWDGSLFPGQPLPPGRIQVALAPRLALPLPVLADGPVVEIDLAVDAAAAPACALLALDPGSAVFSGPPLGQELAGGTVRDGGIEVGGEICDDCADNNGDGQVDLADARCDAAGLTLAKATAGGKKPTRLTATVSSIIGSVDGGLRLTLTIDGAVALCEILPAERFTRKKNGTLKLQGVGRVATLVLKPQKKRSVMRATLVLTGVAVPAGAKQLDLSLQAGTQRFHGAGVLRRKGKNGKVVFP